MVIGCRLRISFGVKSVAAPLLLRARGRNGNREIRRNILNSPHVSRESDGGLVREDEPHLQRVGKE